MTLILLLRTLVVHSCTIRILVAYFGYINDRIVSPTARIICIAYVMALQLGAARGAVAILTSQSHSKGSWYDSL
jgi:hypothetical protein